MGVQTTSSISVLSSILAILPELSLLLLAGGILLYDYQLKPEQRRQLGVITAWGTLLIMIITGLLWFSNSTPAIIWGGMMHYDMMTFLFREMFLVGLLLTSLIAVDMESLQKAEFFALLIAATIGFSFMASANDLIMLYVALETASISLYVLAGFVNNDNLAAEAGMKYFVYGAFASSVMLYGLSLIYGITGTTNYAAVGTILAHTEGIGLPVALIGLLIIVGFGFKISAVPFHFWTPDVYQGGNTPFTAFVSTASKAAAFAMILRVVMSGALGLPDGDGGWGWRDVLIILSVLTMTLGNMAAIWQENIKRMLAYSSIAQAGYLLIGVIVMTPAGAGAIIYYLAMYIVTNIAAFAVIILFANATGSEELKDFSGLSRRSPWLAFVMLFALLSLGGIPPTAGFVGKFLLFKAAIEAGYWKLALVGIINAFIALYYYLSVTKYIYLYRSEDESPIAISRPAQVALVLSLFAIVYLGTFAIGPAYEWTTAAGHAFLTP